MTFHKEDTKAFVKRLLQREEKIGLVLDKASWHTASIVTEFFDDNRDRIRIKYFPTGSVVPIADQKSIKRTEFYDQTIYNNGCPMVLVEKHTQQGNLQNSRTRSI